MKDVVLIPTYNEKKNIGQLIGEVFSLHPEVYIFVIDDNSPDGTAAVVEKLITRHSHLFLLRRAKKEGLGRAYIYALEQLRGDKTIRSLTTMDADGSHQPCYLGNLIGRIDEFDLVVGSRYIQGGEVKNWNLGRRLLSCWANIYINLICGVGIKDMTAGFQCFRRELVEKMNLSELRSVGYAFQLEIKFFAVKKFGAHCLEVPIVFLEREGGGSKMSWSIVKEGLMTPWRMLILKFTSQ